MKKTGLFKIIMFILLGMVVATWIFSASYYNDGNLAELGMYNVGLVDFFSLIFGSFEFSYFLQIFIFLICIGAFYGVLSKTGKYRAWIERIANAFKGTELVFLIICAYGIALMTSILDYGYILLIFFPLLISIILAMGYEKVTAVVATFGAMLIGTIGNILGSNTSLVLADILSLDHTDGIMFRVALLLASLLILFYYLYTAKRVKADKKNEEDDMFLGEKEANKYSIAPIIVVFILLFVFMILGCTTWEKTFDVHIFSTLHTKLVEFTPKFKFPYLHITSDGFDIGTNRVAIFAKIFGSTTAFGEWSYNEMSILLIISSIFVGLCYKVKGIFASMGEGIKKILKPAFMLMLTYCVIYLAGNQMFYPTLASLILKLTNIFSGATNSIVVAIGSIFNIIISSFVMIIGSIFHVDLLYVANYVVPQIATSDANPVLYSLLAQSIYGATMFIAPTSALLVFGL